MSPNRSEWTRRQLLHRSSVASVIGISALAGCLDSETDETSGTADEDESADGDELDEGDESTAMDDAAEDDGDDETNGIVDMTGDETVEIELVDNEGGDGAFAFEPDHVRLSVGTTVRWVSTHDIFHTITSTESLEQKSPSGEFRQTVSAEGDSYEWTADEPGTQFYYCEPHAGFMDGTLEIE
ncbi:cupredoxin domain-containing protein [Natronorubrum aibiense]|uniref:Blue (type 1) copper domain-containing protein n=1 Tax=Natronorubrum aibiense TaxID=348826 RepID=A0A5P9PA48_9EURY|nr:plastocyanin/azurin family copper-binding protein [Natronorubrum aibiense]QFU84740.1 hypothetical protein GCU68_19680 [Natronorubrum aibiense]